LNDARAKYLIVGGYAVIKHTEPRYTKDLDIWVSPDLENAKRVFAALQHFGAPLHGIALKISPTRTWFIIWDVPRPVWIF
jgi:hypothetical protein